jgi:16S rRNA (guanine527-N7)-methyltransferase
MTQPFDQTTGDLGSDLHAGLAALGLPLSTHQEAQLTDFLRMIERWSRVYNLTAIRDPRAMLTQHLFDCLAVLPPVRTMLKKRSGGANDAATPTARVLDVGSGAGLPGVVLAICEPGWRVTCVDAVAKKARFIQQVALELGLNNLSATHQRVETMEGEFDLITSRAFATLAEFTRLTADRLAPEGLWVAMKGNLGDDERTGVPADVNLFHVEPLLVPGLEARRCLAWMKPK